MKIGKKSREEIPGQRRELKAETKAILDAAQLLEPGEHFPVEFDSLEEARKSHYLTKLPAFVEMGVKAKTRGKIIYFYREA